MEDENIQEGLTFGEIWQRILRRIWYVLGAAVAVTLIAVLVVYFAVNPAQQSYSMRFSLVFPTGTESSYPDGEPFFYQEMAAKYYLDKAVKTEGLENLNIDRMIRRDEISVVAETKTENGATEYTGRYTLSVARSYFTGAEQAEKFIRAIAGAVESDMRERAGLVSYAVSRDTFESAPFEERLNLLTQERETLLEKYDEWIAIYDAAYKPIDGNDSSLKEFRAAVTALFGESVQKELENDLKSGGYYFTDNFEEYKTALKAEYSRNKTEIEALKETGGVSSLASVTRSSVTKQPEGEIIVEQPALNVSQRLAYLIERNANILHWLGSTYLGEEGEPAAGTLTAENNDAFAERLEAERVKLENAAKQLTAVTKAVYERGMSARFDEQKIGKEGGVSIILIAVVAFIVGFLAAALIVCIVDGRRKKKTIAPDGAGGPLPENGTPDNTSLDDTTPENLSDGK